MYQKIDDAPQATNKMFKDSNARKEVGMKHLKVRMTRVCMLRLQVEGISRN